LREALSHFTDHGYEPVAARVPELRAIAEATSPGVRAPLVYSVRVSPRCFTPRAERGGGS
ncbi:hypothetical protein ABZS86_29355, partial [Streptomyces sp. NPDC005355]|uniref:hypothetical protein n=1 Tax=Streptomyces sp. NPDC005355 TaxID=3157038 RepID=UPI0033ADD7D4